MLDDVEAGARTSSSVPEMTIEKGFSAGKRRNHYFAVFGHCASLGNAWIYRLTESGFKPSGFLMFSGGVNSAEMLRTGAP
jgi:hypothetical protein